MKLKLKVFDILIFLFVFFIALFLLIKSYKSSLVSDSVCVDANGKLYEYSLSKDGIFEVEGLFGKTQIEIKNHKVHIISSACSGKNCVKQGYGTSIVCLPNKVFVYVKNEGELDAVLQ